MTEQRVAAFVQMNLGNKVRTNHGNMLLDLFKYFRHINQNFTDVLSQVVSDGSENNVAFLMDEERSRSVVGSLPDHFPMLYKNIKVPVEILRALAYTGCSDDNTHAFRNGERIKGFFELGSVITLNAV